MVEIQGENLDNIINNEEEAEPEKAEPIKRSRGRPKKIKPIEEEEEPKPKTRKKRIITAPWRYKENGKYITGGFIDKEYHMKYHREYWREKVRIGWTCPYCGCEQVSNEHKKKHWATNRCRKYKNRKVYL